MVLKCRAKKKKNPNIIPSLAWGFENVSALYRLIAGQSYVNHRTVGLG